MEQTENFSWVFKEDPLELGRYYNQFCNRNEKAYNDYKAMGIKKLTNTEINRSDLKELLQHEAYKKGIKESNMLRFKRQHEKETIWKQIIPEQLMGEIIEQDEGLANVMQFMQTETTESVMMGSISGQNSRADMIPQVRPLSQESSSDAPRENKNESKGYLRSS